MSWRLISRPEVEADIAEAAAWYEERQEGLGADVIREVQSTYADISQNPFLKSEKQARAAARWRLTKRFPYRVIYQIFEPQKLIVVVTVLHSSRHDRRWRKRLL